MQELETRYFGAVQIDEAEVLHFVSPIYGFESLTDYVILYDDGSPDSPFSWLQSTADAQTCFVLMNPLAVRADYAPVPNGEARALLGLAPGERPVCRVMAVVPQDLNKASVNFKSPVFINPAKKCAAQVILDEDYPVRAPLLTDESVC